MANPGSEDERSSAPPLGELRAAYDQQMEKMRHTFAANGEGPAACRVRSSAVDTLLAALWETQNRLEPSLAGSVSLVALGGYGRQHLFPASDVDLLFCTAKGATKDLTRDSIRRFSQALWDCGLKFSPTIRTLQDCERFKASDPEFSLALLDLRFVAGDETLFRALRSKVLDRRTLRETKALSGAVATLTRSRHARFGHTLFHLEPNVKDSPGGLRDAHVCTWLAQLRGEQFAHVPSEAFQEAVAFLTATRVFLHLRHGRDDNTLDWYAQDGAAAQAIGFGWKLPGNRAAPDPASWMRAYFRHARAIIRELARELERSGEQPRPSRTLLKIKAPPRSGFVVNEGVLALKAPRPELDPAEDSEIVLTAFGLIAETGIVLAPSSQERIAAAIPSLSATLEDGPRLWSRLRSILNGLHAAAALREMHALGVLELIVPEFHGIDALVIRDAYHRYTVDEHTFVLLESLHGLAADPPPGAPEWRLRFRFMLRELPHPELLYLAALLHDTGKGRATSNHAAASGRLARDVCARLELGAYEKELVVRLIECHLEMSAALRRDIFDTASVRAFADRVGTPELLRMLTLFTFADISAVHPDALTPWKAENLWRLSMTAANQLDRSVDEDRVHTHGSSRATGADGVTARRGLDTLLRDLFRSSSNPSVPDRAAIEAFLEGFPERYLRTRSADSIREHMLAAAGKGKRVHLTQLGTLQELTVIATDRQHLFTELAATLASWRMEVVTAEAFSNAHGSVVDTFRFTDTYRTLELNPEERTRFLTLIEQVCAGEPLVASSGERSRQRRSAPRRVVETRIDFDNTASSASTLLQMVTQDAPGLLRTTAEVLSDFRCSIEVALIDTEGEMAIDVFYITREGRVLGNAEMDSLRERLLAAIAANLR